MVHCLMMRLNCYRMMVLMLAEYTDLRPLILQIILLMMENYESNKYLLCFDFNFFIFFCSLCFLLYNAFAYFEVMYMFMLIISSFFSSLFTLKTLFFVLYFNLILSDN